MDNLHIKHHFTSVEHPQTNGLAEVANRKILKGLKRRLGEAKGNWIEQLDMVLWVYRTTLHSSTGETPFNFVYGTDAVIPVEIEKPLFRTENFTEEDNNYNTLLEMDLIDERRIIAQLCADALRQRASIQYNKKVIFRRFEIGDLILLKADIRTK